MPSFSPIMLRVAAFEDRRSTRLRLAFAVMAAIGMTSGACAAPQQGEGFQLACRVVGSEKLPPDVTRAAICAEMVRVFGEATGAPVTNLADSKIVGQRPTGKHWAEIQVTVDAPTSAGAAMTFQRGGAVESVPEMQLSIVDRTLNLRSFSTLAKALAAKLPR